MEEDGANVLTTMEGDVMSAVDSQEKVQSILFLNQALSLGGAEVFDSDLLAQFQRKGISVAAYTNNNYFGYMLESRGITALSVPFVVDFIGNGKGLLKACLYGPLLFFWYGVVMYRHKSVDILLLSGFTEKVLATVWALLFGIPVVWIEFGPLEPVFKKFFHLPKFLYCLVSGIPKKVIVPSHNTKKDLLQSGCVNPLKIELIPCGSSQVGAKKYVPSPKPVVVCPSRLEEGKGQNLLIEAFAEVVKKVPDAELRIIGEGDFGKLLQAQVASAQLEDGVRFLGRVSDIRHHLGQAQVVVFPSLWELEGFGLVAIEAMALAKPVVAFNRGPTNEIVRTGNTGLLVPVGDVQALADAIITLLLSPKKRKEMGLAGLKRFRENYTINQIADHYLATCTQVVTLQKVRNA